MEERRSELGGEIIICRVVISQVGEIMGME